MRNYLVTGCTSGIGLGLTAELIRRGARVYGVALDSHIHEQLQAMSETGRFHYSSCDVSRPDKVGDSIREIERNGFEPDVVILNAGINPERFGGGFSLERFEQVMRVNVFGVLAWVDAYLPLFKKRGSGQFVAISSLSAYHGAAGLPAYCASKAAIDRAFESLRADHAADGIVFTTVNLHTVAAGIGADKQGLLVLPLKKAVAGILSAVEDRCDVVSLPAYLGFILKVLQFLPEKVYRALRRWG